MPNSLNKQQAGCKESKSLSSKQTDLKIAKQGFFSVNTTKKTKNILNYDVHTKQHFSCQTLLRPDVWNLAIKCLVEFRLEDDTRSCLYEKTCSCILRKVSKLSFNQIQWEIHYCLLLSSLSVRGYSDRAPHLTSSCSRCSPNQWFIFLVIFCRVYSFLQIDLIATMPGCIFHSLTHRRTGRYFTGGAEEICLEITISPESNFFSLIRMGLKPLVNLFYTVEFVYSGFVGNVNSPITLHFVRSRWHLLHAFQFACNVISAITFFMQSSRGALTGKFCSYLAY